MQTTLLSALVDIQAVQYGEFTLKSGQISPVYVDLRRMIAHPQVLKMTADLMVQQLADIPFDVVCGVPYAALPLACAICLKQEYPMLMYRKEAKGHGTKKQIEGVFQVGQRSIIIEDVVTTGGSILSVLSVLREEGLQVTDVFSVVDRQQGGRECLEKEGVRLHSLMTLEALLSEV